MLLSPRAACLLPLDALSRTVVRPCMKMSFLPWRSGPTVYKKGCEAGRAICTEAGLPFTYMGSRARLMPAGLVIGRRSDGAPRVGEDAPQERPVVGVRGTVDAPPLEPGRSAPPATLRRVARHVGGSPRHGSSP